MSYDRLAPFFDILEAPMEGWRFAHWRVSDSGTISKGPLDAYPEEKKIFQEGFIR